ncbi:MAG: hypothetical protein Q7T19_12475 [Caulobacter sp.]|nr:hypothetical protein [Caulobacter sp.]
MGDVYGAVLNAATNFMAAGEGGHAHPDGAARTPSVSLSRDRGDVGVGQTMKAVADDPLFGQFATQAVEARRPG